MSKLITAAVFVAGPILILAVTHLDPATQPHLMGLALTLVAFFFGAGLGAVAHAEWDRIHADYYKSMWMIERERRKAGIPWEGED